MLATNPKGEFKGSEIDIKNNKSLQLLLQGGLLCSDAVLEEKEGKWFVKGDPTEGALVVAAVKAGYHETEMRLENPRIEEIPFSSERKRMTTIHQMAGRQKNGVYERGSGGGFAEMFSYLG